jgi:[ribosomal protein S5]-alanine N-acetyltransferase
MREEQLSVRQLRVTDFEYITNYFLQSDKDFLFNMGVDVLKLPSKEFFLQMLEANFYLPSDKKQFFYIIWLLNNQPVGHSNINKIIFGDSAYMHLHLWQGNTRRKGMGHHLLTITLPYFFNTFKLKKIYCEPSALNPAPNKTLQKLGFDFIMSYDTVPGWINFYQKVNKWCLTEEKFKKLYL